MARAKATIDHDTIKQWVEARRGCPAHVKGTKSNGDPGILRIDYTGFAGQRSLERLSWRAFFEAFERNQLALLYQDEPGSRFSKLVSRDSVKLEGEKGSPQKNSRGRAGSSKATKNGRGRRQVARRGSQTDATGLLMRQHREVEQLFDKLEKARGNAQKDRIFYKLSDALAAHSKIEETIFYPVAFNEETEEQLREAVEEHLVVKRLLADLMEMECSDPQFMGKVSVLKEMVKHHVEEEEGELFEKVREQSSDDLVLLGQRMQEKYRQLIKQQPSSVVPDETRAAAEL